MKSTKTARGNEAYDTRCECSQGDVLRTDGEWSLAPAYDLTYDNTLGEHATTINFKGKPTDDDLVTVGTNAHLSPQHCRQILDEVREATQELQKYFL